MLAVGTCTDSDLGMPAQLLQCFVVGLIGTLAAWLAWWAGLVVAGPVPGWLLVEWWLLLVEWWLLLVGWWLLLVG